jgi:hypothetical protein
LRVLESIDALGIFNSQGESADEWVNVDLIETIEKGRAKSPAEGPRNTMADARRLFK